MKLKDIKPGKEFVYGNCLYTMTSSGWAIQLTGEMKKDDFSSKRMIVMLKRDSEYPVGSLAVGMKCEFQGTVFRIVETGQRSVKVLIQRCGNSPINKRKFRIREQEYRIGDFIYIPREKKVNLVNW